MPQCTERKNGSAVQRLPDDRIRPAFLRSPQLPPLPSARIAAMDFAATNQAIAVRVFYLLTFTVPNEWRQLAWRHQTIVYDLIINPSLTSPLLNTLPCKS